MNNYHFLKLVANNGVCPLENEELFIFAWFQFVVWHFSRKAALTPFIQLCQYNTLRLKILSIVKT